EECLVSLAGQDPKPAFVIVVDGNERPVAEKAAAIHGFAVIRESNRGPAHARNTGYLEAQRRGADIVCFLDDDAVAPPDWFGRHVHAHQIHPEAGAVGGGIRNLHLESMVAEYGHRVAFRPLRDHPGPVRMVPTLNVSYKAACFDQIGLFDTTLTHAGEDV